MPQRKRPAVPMEPATKGMRRAHDHVITYHLISSPPVPVPCRIPTPRCSTWCLPHIISFPCLTISLHHVAAHGDSQELLHLRRQRSSARDDELHPASKTSSDLDRCRRGRRMGKEGEGGWIEGKCKHSCAIRGGWIERECMPSWAMRGGWN